MSEPHPNAQLIERFYQAFQKHDGAAMAACYHRDVEFSDPVFQNLKGPQAGGMWRMLTGRAKDLTLTFSVGPCDDKRGRAHWEATYTFSATGNKVLNVIDAEFEFQDGLIRRHRDSFDLWKWAGMALGLKGKLLGFLPAVQNKIRAQAMSGLEQFLAKQNG